MKNIFILAILCGLISSCDRDYKPMLTKKLDKQYDSFVIDNLGDTLLQGSEGTLVYIEKESFTFKNGLAVQGPIGISLKEVYRTSDIIGQNISTVSSDGILETGGMIDLRAYSKGEELQLAAGKTIVVHFPKGAEKSKMNLFYGIKDSSGTVTWDLEENSTYKIRSSIRPWLTKYPGLDDQHLYLSTGKIWADTLSDLFNLSTTDLEMLVNAVVDLNYVVHSNGVLEFKNTTGSTIDEDLRSRLETVVKNFPLCKPYTIAGKAIEMEGFFKISAIVTPPLYVSKAGYSAVLEQKMKDSEGTKTALELAELQYYIFDSRQLGWMNCDRFIDATSKRINFVVQVPKSDNIFAKIVFTNYKTVMTGDQQANQFVFNQLPVNEPVKIVVVAEEKGQPLLQIIDTRTSVKPLQIPDLTSYSLEVLQEKLKGLD